MIACLTEAAHKLQSEGERYKTLKMQVADELPAAYEKGGGWEEEEQCCSELLDPTHSYNQPPQQRPEDQQPPEDSPGL